MLGNFVTIHVFMFFLFKMIVFSFEFVSLRKKNILPLFLLNKCKFSYLIGYRCLNLNKTRYFPFMYYFVPNRTAFWARFYHLNFATCGWMYWQILQSSSMWFSEMFHHRFANATQVLLWKLNKGKLENMENKQITTTCFKYDHKKLN